MSKHPNDPKEQVCRAVTTLTAQLDAQLNTLAELPGLDRVAAAQHAHRAVEVLWERVREARVAALVAARPDASLAELGGAAGLSRSRVNDVLRAADLRAATTQGQVR